MNKRIAKKINTRRKKRKEYLRKKNILFLDKEKLKKSKYEISNRDLSLHAGQKILLSNDFNDWKRAGINKNEFLYFKHKNFITTIVRLEGMFTIVIKNSYAKIYGINNHLYPYWYICPYMIQEL